MLPHSLTVVPLLAGDDGTAQTLRAMRAFVDTAKIHPYIRQAVLDAVQELPEKAGRGEVAALLEWVSGHVRYVRDPVDAEYVQNPVLLLDMIRRDGIAYGDCDDMATLFASLAEAAGFPTRFVVVGPDTGAFTHVYVETEIDGAWVAADPAARKTLGWAPRSAVHRRASTMQVRQLGDDDWFSSIVSGLTDAAKSALPVLERYGVVTPTQNQPLLPVGGIQGAAWSSLASVGPLGLSYGAWLAIGAVGAVVLLSSGRR